LNEWPETYSYALTKGLLSNLPIFYSPLGALPERLANHNHCIEAIEPLLNSFSTFCDLIMNQGFQTMQWQNFQEIIYFDIPLAYQTLIQNIVSDLSSQRRHDIDQIHKKSHPFALYHYQNIDSIYQTKPKVDSLQTPLSYILTPYRNTPLFSRQCHMAYQYGFRGFAIYYPSKDFTNANFDNFLNHAFTFSDPIEFSLFFVWDVSIDNEASLLTICKYLLQYVTHPRYYRDPVSNRPILAIKSSCLKYVITMIESFFTPELLVIICDGDAPDAQSIQWHPTSKMTGNYNEYIDSIRESYALRSDYNIPTAFAFIDNTWHTNSEHRITQKTHNFSLSAFASFLAIQFSYLQSHSPSPYSSLFLFNAWNDWEQQMILEPSNENGYVLLQTWFTQLCNSFL
jgi:hypothetical protein